LREEQRRQTGCPALDLCREPLGQDTRFCEIRLGSENP